MLDWPLARRLPRRVRRLLPPPSPQPPQLLPFRRHVARVDGRARDATAPAVDPAPVLPTGWYEAALPATALGSSVGMVNELHQAGLG